MSLVIFAACEDDDAGDPVDAAVEDGMDVPTDIPSDDGRDTTPDGAALWAECPDAPLLGVAGTSSVDSFETGFRWEDGWSIGEPMTFQVATDVRGIAITVDLPESYTGLAYIENNGAVFLDINNDDPDLEGTSPFFHTPDRSGSIAIPMDNEISVEPGCLTIIPAGLDDLSDYLADIYIATKRGTASRMDVTAVVVGDTVIEESEIEAAFTATSALYEGANAGSVRDVEIVYLEWDSPFIDSETEDIHSLRAAVVGDDPGRLNVFFIQDFLEEGTAGVAAGIPGPVWAHGLAGSGVIISVDNNLNADGATVDIDFMASVLAHEVAHQVGLFHSTEAEGLFHDEFDDTAACTTAQDADGDGYVDADECIDHGGRNFMFWTGGDFDQNEISRSQARIISLSPVMR